MAYTASDNPFSCQYRVIFKVHCTNVLDYNLTFYNISTSNRALTYSESEGIPSEILSRLKVVNVGTTITGPRGTYTITDIAETDYQYTFTFNETIQYVNGNGEVVSTNSAIVSKSWSTPNNVLFTQAPYSTSPQLVILIRGGITSEMELTSSVHPNGLPWSYPVNRLNLLGLLIDIEDEIIIGSSGYNVTNSSATDTTASLTFSNTINSATIIDSRGVVIQSVVSGTNVSFTKNGHYPYTVYINETPSFNIYVNESGGGVCSANLSTATSGTRINVTFTPDSGYSVDWSNVTITTIGAATVLIKDTDTTGHFTMPAGNVTINPAFTKVLRAGVQVSGGHGTATVSNEHPAQGDTVTITCYPDTGYTVDTVTSFDATISKVSTNTYQFTMPNVDVLATVTFKENPLITITVEPTSGGTVSVVPTSGYAGTTCTITISPNTGYNLKNLYVLAGTDGVPTTKVDDTHYTFVLPSFNVVVRALFSDGDPFSPGGSSTPSTPGGTGSFDDTTIPITPPAMPSVSLTDIGLYTIFSLSQSQLSGFTQFLWSNLFSLDTATKYITNATENILSLHVLPFAINTSSSREIKFMGLGSGVTGSIPTYQYQQFDCGSVAIQEYYGSAMDYNPWTKIQLYVPYCGEIALDPDEVMGQTVNLKYTVDALTGDCYASVSVGGTTLYQLSGNCAMHLPVTAANWSRIIQGTRSALMLAAGIGAAATGAVGAGLASIGATGIVDSLRQGDVARADSDLGTLRTGQAMQSTAPSVGSTNSYMATMAQKSTIHHTGINTGGSSFMAVQVPYILIKRPRQSLPENFNKYVGYPANFTRTLGHMTGYTQIVDVNLNSIPCTEAERNEIDRLLKSGVIL